MRHVELGLFDAFSLGYEQDRSLRWCVMLDKVDIRVIQDGCEVYMDPGLRISVKILDIEEQIQLLQGQLSLMRVSGDVLGDLH